MSIGPGANAPSDWSIAELPLWLAPACYRASAMSPLSPIERTIFEEIIEILRRWADSLERHVEQVGAAALGPDWPDRDLLDLYESWLQVGFALRDVARTTPSGQALEPRPEVVAMRDGLARIADIVERQATI